MGTQKGETGAMTKDGNQKRETPKNKVVTLTKNGNPKRENTKWSDRFALVAAKELCLVHDDGILHLPPEHHAIAHQHVAADVRAASDAGVLRFRIRALENKLTYFQ